MLGFLRGGRARSLLHISRMGLLLLMSTLILGSMSPQFPDTTPSRSNEFSDISWFRGLNPAANASLMESFPVSGAALSGEVQHTTNELIFVENVGQFDDGVLYAVQTNSGVLFLGQDVLWITTV